MVTTSLEPVLSMRLPSGRGGGGGGGGGGAGGAGDRGGGVERMLARSGSPANASIMANDPSFMSEGRSHMAVSSEADNTFDSFLLDDYAPSHNGNMAVPAGRHTLQHTTTHCNTL